MIIMGDGIAQSGAQAELTRVAELTGAEVWGANSSEVNIGANHPLFKGLLGHMFGEHSKAIVARADAILVCGTYVFPEVFPALDDVFSSGAKVIHIDLDGYEIAKNFPVDLGLLGDPKTSLAALADALLHHDPEPAEVSSESLGGPRRGKRPGAGRSACCRPGGSRRGSHARLPLHGRIGRACAEGRHHLR